MFVTKQEIVAYDTEEIIAVYWVLSKDIESFTDWVFKYYNGAEVYIHSNQFENLWHE